MQDQSLCESSTLGLLSSSSSSLSALFNRKLRSLLSVYLWASLRDFYLWLTFFLLFWVCTSRRALEFCKSFLLTFRTISKKSLPTNTFYLHSPFSLRWSKPILKIVFLVTLILHRSLLVKLQYFSARLLSTPILQYLEFFSSLLSFFTIPFESVAIAVSLTWICSALSLGYKGLVWINLNWPEEIASSLLMFKSSALITSMENPLKRPTRNLTSIALKMKLPNWKDLSQLELNTELNSVSGS